MKKILITTFFCFFLLVAVVNAEGFNYANPEKHYSFSIPVGWKEIQKSIIDEFTNSITQQSPVDYVVGFQFEDVPDFQYPYILVQEHKINTPSYSKVVEMFTFDNSYIDKKFDEYSIDKSKLFTDMNLGKPYVDSERNIVFMNIESDVVNVGKVKGLMAMFLGKHSIIQLNFYSIEAEYAKDLLTFNQIIDSFKYEFAYRYNEDEAKKNDKGALGRAAERGVIGAITGGLFALLGYGFFRISRKKIKFR